MILLISQAQFESTTDQIIDWLDYFNIPFKRLNGIDFYKNVKIEFLNNGCSIRIKDTDLDDIKVVWIRRWLSKSDKDQIFIKPNPEDAGLIGHQLNAFVQGELGALRSFFFDSIPKEKLFGRTETREINKLTVLKKASELGITIPDTYVMTRRDAFEELVKTKKLITKAISNAPTVETSNSYFCGYTSTIDKLPDEIINSFSPSLFQAQIEKKYEIRVFYLSGKFYSMAIFSQGDPQTQVDFRLYNNTRPNRTVPYQLPEDLERKLLDLAEFFELKSGSFDLIKSIDNQYVFLEVNPEGQFGMVSFPCNYHLEKKFARELINFSK